MTLPNPLCAFAEASAYVVPFGVYAGKSIDAIAMTDVGLLWLDWARDIAQKPALAEALRIYLTDSTIASDLAKLTRSGAQT